MREIIENVQAIIDKYNERLAHNGITITASKRYFEDEVNERTWFTGTGVIWNVVDRAFYRRRERKNGYNYERNRYHSIVLSVAPTQGNIVNRENCREYAFVLKKVERAHIGMKPRRVEYEKGRLLSKIERLILKILKKSQTKSPLRLCKNTLYDALRYAYRQKYGYKRRFLGKERGVWVLIFSIFTVVIGFDLCVALWFICKLF